jgi:O-antigen/teichoic acid export membrane protein
VNVRGVLGFALGPLAAALFGFITLPVVTWFYAAEDIGRLAMLQVAVNLTMLLFGLGLDQAYVREYHGHDNRAALFKMAVAPGLCLLGLAALVVLLEPSLLARALFDLKDGALALMVLVCVFSAFALRFLSLVLRMEERGVAFSVGQFLPKLIFLLLIGSYAIFGFGDNTRSLLLAHTLSLCAVALVFFSMRWRVCLDAVKQPLALGELRALLRYGFPLIFAGLAFWGLTASDKILLRALADLDQLGVYSVAVSFAGAALVIKMIFQTLWAPQVYKWEAEGESNAMQRIQSMNHYMLVAVTLSFCLVGSLSWLVDYVLPPEYRQVKLVLIACLGYPLLLTLSETTAVGINLAKKTGHALAVAVAAFVINVGLNLLLIPAHGAAGAAVATVVSFWLFFIIRSECAYRVWKPFPRREQYLVTTVLTALAVWTTLGGDRVGGMIHVYWGATLIFFVGYYAKTIIRSVAFVRAVKGAPAG